MQKLDPKVVIIFWLQLFTRMIFYGVVLLALVGAPILAELQDGAGGSFLDRAFVSWRFWLLVFFLGVMLFSYLWAKLSYYFYRYELREDGFRKEYGVIWKKYVTIPYDRIQNVDIYRGLIARLLGLSDLNIQTAGAGMPQFGEGRLPGLSREVAEQMRDELIKRARSSRSQGL